jgi:signal transduction histidine kinase
VKVIDLSDLPLEETRSRLSALPLRTIVYYSGIWVDGAGQPFTPREALRRLAPAVNAPIFGYADTFVGHGIVGGMVADGGAIGSEFARLVSRVLAGEAPDDIPVRRFESSRPAFDARQLDRWRLSESRLPAGSRILFRPPSLWQAHRPAVVAAVVGAASAAAFIAALMFEVRRRRLLQADLQETSARLINIQEDERSRIARELHDDVSQRLALLALEGEMLQSDGEVTPDERRARSGRLIDQTRALASDIHRISHELHPAVLDQLGLVAGLRHFADDLRRLHDIGLAVEEQDWPAEVPKHIELAFYRVAQESLQNVVRHSGAREASVLLVAEATTLAMTVTDDGRGFDEAASAGARLGMASMRERMRQIGGQLTVESDPDKGTMVCATVDRDARRS